MPFAAEIGAIRDRDPAARTTLEIVLTYPGLHAIVLHRGAAWLSRRRRRLLARFVSHFARFVTGIEIHPGAVIGHGLFIDHGMGVVIGETTIIGDNVTIYQGVTLGGTGKQRGKRHPTVEDDVVLGVGASVLGAVTIGQGARVGAGAVVLRDVPPHTTAVGVPARAVLWRDPAAAADRFERLPDPTRDAMAALVRRVEALEAELGALTGKRPPDGPGSSVLSDNAAVGAAPPLPGPGWDRVPASDERTPHGIDSAL